MRAVETWKGEERVRAEIKKKEKRKKPKKWESVREKSGIWRSFENCDFEFEFFQKDLKSDGEIMLVFVCLILC